jgi:carboxypeptidase Taq
MEEKFQELKSRLAEISDLEMVVSLLNWDQSTYMPPGGAPARGRQMATLARLAQEKFSDPIIGQLLDDLQPCVENLAYDSDEASLVRRTRQEYERVLKVPPAFMAEYINHAASLFQLWTVARPANDFTAVLGGLQKTLDLSRQMANYFPGYEHIADPLIELVDYGMKASSLQSLFAELRRELVPIVQAIASQPLTADDCLHQYFPKSQQQDFSPAVIRQLGYDFDRGRLDETHHPFMTKFSLGDIRIMTRYAEYDLTEALFGSIHEAGHAMYEQGIRRDFEATPLTSGISAGLHESQSRLWENIVGRSHSFWEFYYPRLQAIFGEQLKNTSLDSFYRAINRVERSLIRTAADEVTYNLHIMLRFDLELALLDGSLEIRDLPEAWNNRFQEDFGITPPDDRDGVLQDVHWFNGFIGGAFQGYTLGNLLSVQFYDAAIKAHPAIPEEISQGHFETLRQWLTQNIYQHGSKFTTQELVQRVTGNPIQIEPYIRYLRAKFGDLYDL